VHMPERPTHDKLQPPAREIQQQRLYAPNAKGSAPIAMLPVQ